MRKLIALEFVTLDRVIQAGGGPEEDTSGGFEYGGWVAPLSDLLQTLMKHDLVDEFWLKIFPITLGSGKRLFTEGTIPAAFKVTESLVSPSGIIVANYQRDGAVKTGSF